MSRRKRTEGSVQKKDITLGLRHAVVRYLRELRSNSDSDNILIEEHIAYILNLAINKGIVARPTAPVRRHKFYRPVSYGASDKKGKNKYRVHHTPWNDHAAAVAYVRQNQKQYPGLELEHVTEDVTKVEKFDKHDTGNAT